MTPRHLPAFVRMPLIALLALLGALGLASCSDDESAGPEEGATVDDIREDEDEALGDDEAFDENAFFEDPEPFLGDTVTVSAEVAEIIDSTAFTIAGEGGPQPVLVVSAMESMPTIDDNTVVEVTGTVREFVIADIEADLGIDLDDELFVDFEDEHVLVADSVSILDAEEDGEDG